MKEESFRKQIKQWLPTLDRTTAPSFPVKQFFKDNEQTHSWNRIPRDAAKGKGGEMVKADKHKENNIDKNLNFRVYLCCPSEEWQQYMCEVVERWTESRDLKLKSE